MSLPIWTPAALSSEAKPLEGRFWRLVEAQHRVSTLKLVDTLEEQTLLESLLEETKPSYPPECAGMDYLLATPFRYGAAYPHGSRFRRAGMTPGVFYCSAKVETAVAELAFYRLLFYAESPDTPLPQDAAEYSAFAVEISTKAAIDLTRGALAVDAAYWTDRMQYEACQRLADAARAVAVAVEAIVYASVRDPAGGENLAVLTAKAFAKKAPVDWQTWRIRVTRRGAQALCNFPLARMEFPVGVFAADERLKPLIG